MVPPAVWPCRGLVCVVELLLDHFALPAFPVPGAGVEGLAGDAGGLGDPGLGCAGFDGVEQQKVELFTGGVDVGGGLLDAIRVVVGDLIGDPCGELLALAGVEVNDGRFDVAPVPVGRVGGEAVDVDFDASGQVGVPPVAQPGSGLGVSGVDPLPDKVRSENTRHQKAHQDSARST